MKGRAFLLGIPIALVTAAMAFAPPRRTMLEKVERELPELHLVARDVDRFSGQVSLLYTGQADSEVISQRLEKLLVGNHWGVGRRKLLSAFPYSNTFNGCLDIPLWARLPFLHAVALEHLKPDPPLDLHVMKGRAGARPEGGPWTSVLIRENIRMAYPDESEPIQGFGVQLQ